MNETTTSLIPKWFSISSILLLIWNVLGLIAFVLSLTMLGNREALEKAEFKEEQIDLMLSTPGWVTIAFGVAVIFGVLGCIALVMKKKLAIPLLIISLLGVLAQNAYIFFMSDTVKVMGIGASPLIILAAIALVPFAMHGAKKGWLR